LNRYSSFASTTERPQNATLGTICRRSQSKPSGKHACAARKESETGITCLAQIFCSRFETAISLLFSNSQTRNRD
jgi:hypothetical protein